MIHDADHVPIYEERDIVAQGEVYLAHVQRMTDYGLHSKSAIAAELAHRDIIIMELREKLNQLAKGLMARTS